MTLMGKPLKEPVEAMHNFEILVKIIAFLLYTVNVYFSFTVHI